MATRKEEKKEKEEKEKKALEELRSREGFMPYYSDAFFEGITDFRFQYTRLIRLAIVLIELYIVLYIGNAGWLCLITVCLIVADSLLHNKVENWMKRFGYQMESDALIRTAWGRRKVIPYMDIQSALKTTPIKIAVKAIMVPSTHGYISIPYEVGNAKQQKHVREYYDVLRNKVCCEMPMMRTEYISYFDRMYTYNKRFRNGCIWLCIAQIMVFGCDLGQSDELFGMIDFMLPLLFQCGFLANMAKSVRLGMKNAKEFQDKITQYPGIIYDLKYYKNGHFMVAAAIVSCLNFIVVWYSWMM